MQSREPGSLRFMSRAAVQDPCIAIQMTLDVWLTGTMIRKAEAEDLPKIRDIEAAAGEAFRTIGMGDVAEDVPPSLEALAIYQ